MFKLQIGDVCKLKEVIPGMFKSGDWKTGLYRVRSIHSMWTSPKDLGDPKTKSYTFDKIKKDGTRYKSFSNGYNCLAWDKKIEEGTVEIVKEIK